jgi:hypothetical protein
MPRPLRNPPAGTPPSEPGAATNAGSLSAQPESDGDPRLAFYLQYNSATLADAIRRIKNGEIVGAVFKGAVAIDVCRYAAARIEAYAHKTYYARAAGIAKIGLSLFEGGQGPFELVDYFRTAASQLAISRGMFPPGHYPLDILRLTLDDGWPHDVSRLRLEHGLCQLGLIRYLDAGGAILPHNDAAAADMEESFLAQAIDIQIAVNVLLRAPESGGWTSIYPRRLSRSEYDAGRRPTPDEYALRDECLPPNPVVIRPEVGDLYLFDSSLPHSVAECSGPRATLSAFIGVRRNGDLALFS